MLRPRSPPRLTHAGLALVSVPMGIMSYAYRGSAEDFTAHPLPGGRATAISYRASAVLVAALAVGPHPPLFRMRTALLLLLLLTRVCARAPPPRPALPHLSRHTCGSFTRRRCSSCTG